MLNKLLWKLDAHGTVPGRKGLNTQWLKTNTGNREGAEEGRRAGIPRKHSLLVDTG